MNLKQYYLLLIFALLFSVASCIVNAEIGKIEDAPYLVLITIPFRYYCAGSILSKYFVLTAANCIIGDEDKFIVRAGSNFNTKGGNVHLVDVITRHENFSIHKKAAEKKWSNDVAVVKVKKPFKYCATIQPIQLLKSNEPTKPSTKAVTVGWGKIETGLIPTQFRKLKMTIIDKSSCNETVTSWAKLDPDTDAKGLAEGQVCAQSDDPKNKYPCVGDSGGPLVIGNKLAGIFIYGGGCDFPNYTSKSPSVYSEVGYFRNWIDQHVTYDDELHSYWNFMNLVEI